MRCWDRAREASLETVTCSWNVCGVMRTERQEGTCRADTRSRHADSGLFMLFVIVAKMGGRPRPGRPPSIINVFYDVMMTLPAANLPTHSDNPIVKKIRLALATSCVTLPDIMGCPEGCRVKYVL